MGVATRKSTTKTTEAKWDKSQGFDLVRHIAIDKIEPDKHQVRRKFDSEAINELAESMKSVGQLQPIKVYETDRGQFQILFGERRYRAASVAGLATMACIVLPELPSKQARALMQLSENLQRQDMNPMDTAFAFVETMHVNQWTAKELAEKLGIKPEAVSKAKALTKLSLDVQDKVRSGALAPATAYHISRLGSFDEQKEVATDAIDRDLTRDQVMAEVQARVDGRVLPNQSTYIDKAPEPLVEPEATVPGPGPKVKPPTPAPVDIPRKIEKPDKADFSSKLPPLDDESDSVYGWSIDYQTFLDVSKFDFNLPEDDTFAIYAQLPENKTYKDLVKLLEVALDMARANERLEMIQGGPARVGDRVMVCPEAVVQGHQEGQKGTILSHEPGDDRLRVKWDDDNTMIGKLYWSYPQVLKLIEVGGDA